MTDQIKTENTKETTPENHVKTHSFLEKFVVFINWKMLGWIIIPYLSIVVLFSFAFGTRHIGNNFVIVAIFLPLIILFAYMFSARKSKKYIFNIIHRIIFFSVLVFVFFYIFIIVSHPPPFYLALSDLRDISFPFFFPVVFFSGLRLVQYFCSKEIRAIIGNDNIASCFVLFRHARKFKYFFILYIFTWLVVLFGDHIVSYMYYENLCNSKSGVHIYKTVDLPEKPKWVENKRLEIVPYKYRNVSIFREIDVNNKPRHTIYLLKKTKRGTELFDVKNLYGKPRINKNSLIFDLSYKNKTSDIIPAFHIKYTNTFKATFLYKVSEQIAPPLIETTHTTLYQKDELLSEKREYRFFGGWLFHVFHGNNPKKIHECSDNSKKITDALTVKGKPLSSEIEKALQQTEKE